jgi:hypothetical protein
MVLGDSGEADVELVFVVFSPDVDRRPLFRQRSQPIFACHMGHVFR